MAQLTAIADALLSQASSALVPKGGIHEQLCPRIGVKETTGKLAKYGQQHLRIERSFKAGRGQYRRVESITRSQSTYTVEGHGLEAIVTADDYRNVQVPYDAERDEVMGVSSMILLEKEKVWADTLTSTTNITQNTTLSGTSQFSDFNNSDPVNIFQTARNTVRNGSGLPPDTAAMDWAVFNVLRFHPQMLDAVGFKYARPGGLSSEELAIAMGVKRLLVADAVYNSAVEGQTDSLAAVWGKHIVFGVFPQAAEQYQVSVGYRVEYADKAPRQVYKSQNFNPPGSTLILVEDAYDFLLSNAAAAYLIKSAVA